MLATSSAELNPTQSCNRDRTDGLGPSTNSLLITICLLSCGALLIPQAFVANSWQLIGLRFLMGISLAGLLPAIGATIRHNVPQRAAGTILGYNTSAQYAGQVLGPLAGGFVGGHIGMRAVFLATSLIMLGGAAFSWTTSRQASRTMSDAIPKA